MLDNKAPIHKLYPDINFMYRPNGICFKKDSIINNINISWINPPHNNGIFFDYVGSTDKEPCNWQEYEKQLKPLQIRNSRQLIIFNLSFNF